MATRDEFLKQLWDEIINPTMQEHWIDNIIRASEKHPESSFADVGPALQRLLARGADRRDLSLVARYAAYEAVFGTLYSFSDPGVEEGEADSLHESLLSADPSGLEARTGSAPQKE